MTERRTPRRGGRIGFGATLLAALLTLWCSRADAQPAGPLRGGVSVDAAGVGWVGTIEIQQDVAARRGSQSTTISCHATLPVRGDQPAEAFMSYVNIGTLGSTTIERRGHGAVRVAPVTVTIGPWARDKRMYRYVVAYGLDPPTIPVTVTRPGRRPYTVQHGCDVLSIEGLTSDPDRLVGEKTRQGRVGIGPSTVTVRWDLRRASVLGPPEEDPALLHALEQATEGYLDCLNNRPEPRSVGAELDELPASFTDWGRLAADVRARVARGFGYHLCKSIELGQLGDVAGAAPDAIAALRGVNLGKITGALFEFGGKVRDFLKAQVAAVKKLAGSFKKAPDVPPAKSPPSPTPPPPPGAPGSPQNPLRGSAIVANADNLAGQTVDLGGARGVITIGEKINTATPGKVGTLYTMPGRPGELIKVIHNVGELGGPDAARRQAAGSVLLNQAGLPNASVVASGLDPPFVIVQDIHAGPWAAKGARLAGAELTRAERLAVKQLYDDMAKRGLVWFDGHRGNVFFFQDGGKLRAGILDQDFVNRLEDLHPDTVYPATLFGTEAFKPMTDAMYKPGSVSASTIMTAAYKVLYPGR